MKQPGYMRERILFARIIDAAHTIEEATEDTVRTGWRPVYDAEEALRVLLREWVTLSESPVPAPPVPGSSDRTEG